MTFLSIRVRGPSAAASAPAANTCDQAQAHAAPDCAAPLQAPLVNNPVQAALARAEVVLRTREQVDAAVRRVYPGELPATVGDALATLGAGFTAAAENALGPLEALPVEMQHHIFKSLDPASLVAMGCVSKSLRSLTREDDLWHHPRLAQLSQDGIAMLPKDIKQKASAQAQFFMTGFYDPRRNLNSSLWFREIETATRRAVPETLDAMARRFIEDGAHDYDTHRGWPQEALRERIIKAFYAHAGKPPRWEYLPVECTDVCAVMSHSLQRYRSARVLVRDPEALALILKKLGEGPEMRTVPYRTTVAVLGRHLPAIRAAHPTSQFMYSCQKKYFTLCWNSD